MGIEKSAYNKGLTAREWQVFWLEAAERLSNQETADRLQVSVATVKAHKSNIRHALGVWGREGIAEWYARNPAAAAHKWLEKTAPERVEDMAEAHLNGPTDDTVYRLLTGTADYGNSVFGAISYINSLPPLVAAFINCHLELMRLSGVVVEGVSLPRPHLANGPQLTLDAAQDEALSCQDDVELAALAQQAAWARTSALGIVAAAGALLDKVNERIDQSEVAGEPEPLLNDVVVSP